MKELLIFLCTMNPCIELPEEKILMVPNPFIVSFYVDPDDFPLYECEGDEMDGWKIKWLKPVLGA